MNKIYKVVYNKARNCYIVASEIAKSSTKSASRSKQKAAALLCVAVLCGGITASATAPNVTYDDENKTRITLADAGSEVDILGVKGGNMYAGSTHAVNGNDLNLVNERVSTLSNSLDTINENYATLNNSVLDNASDILDLQTKTNTISQKVEKGYSLQINGVQVKNATPNSNEVNFKTGDHVSITNDNGSLKFSITDNGAVEANNAQFVTGGTVFNALDAEKTARETAIGTISGTVHYISADKDISSNLSALDAQVNANATGLAKEITDRTNAIAKEVTDRKDAITDAINDEVTNRNEAIKTAVKTETDARTADVKAINDKLGTISSDGSYSYITAGGTVSDNLTKLDKCVSDNKSAIDKETQDRKDAIGTITSNTTYITADGSISSNLTKLDSQVKSNTDKLSGLTNDLTSLTDNAVQYTDGTKSTVRLGGTDGTTVTNVKAGELSATSKEAVNGSQLFTTNANVTKEIADREAAIGTISSNVHYISADKDISSNLSALDAQVNTNATDLAKEITDRTNAIAKEVTDRNTAITNAINTEVTNRDAAIKTAVKAENDARIADVKDINDKLGTISKDGSHSYITAGGTVSDNLTKLDKGVSDNKTSITDLTNKFNTLNADAVLYSDASTITLRGEQGAVITNLKAVELTADSTAAVTGAQLYESNRRISLNTTNINDLSNSIGALRTSINDQTARIDKLSNTVTKINNSVSQTNSSVTRLAKTNANQDLSNLSDEGKATLSAAAQDAVQQYFKDHQTASTLAMNQDVATFATPIAVQASPEPVTYDDSTKSRITLGDSSNTVDILGVKGGNVNQGSTHAANGNDVYLVDQRVNTLSNSLDTINENYATLNNNVLDNASAILDLQTKTNTINQKVEKGYSFQINGVQVKKATPSSNEINFKAGTNIAITDANGSIQFDIQGTGAIASGNTGLISGDTAFNALEEKANTTLANLTNDGKTVIKNLAKGSIKVINGNGTTVSSTTDGDGNISYAVNIKAGSLADGGDGFVTADSVNAALATKANLDASNINTKKFAEKLGTGVVTDGDTNLVTGGTVYNAIKNIQGGTGGLITKVDVDMGNISIDGKTVIKNLAKETIKVADGKYTTVSNETDTEGNSTYKVNVTADGAIEDGNTGLITGDTAKKALDTKANKDLSNIGEEGKKVIKDTMKAGMDKKADNDLSNLTDEAKNRIKEALATDLSNKANIDASNLTGHVSEWANVLGTGKIEKGNKNLVTGDAVYSAVSVKADKSYVDAGLNKKANTEDVNNALNGKANTDLSNISNAGKNIIKETMKDDLSKKADKDYVDNALAGKVDKSDFDTVKNQVEQNKTDLANKADKSYVDSKLNKKADANNVYTKDETNQLLDSKIDTKVDAKIDSVKESIANDLQQDTSTKDKWQEALGDGTNEKGNTGLINGDTLHNAIDDLKKDGVGLVRQDTDTINVASDSEAKKVDFKGTDSEGNNFDRVLTGIKTNDEDMSSAANVGYVQGVASDLESQMNYMKNRLANDIKEAGAVASALAGLHHIDYDPDDKLDFAVSTAGYRGKSATALGAFYQPNENIMFSLAGTIGSSHNAWNAGISFKIGSGSDSPVLSRRVLGNRVNVLAAQNQQLAEQNEKLEQDVKDMQDKMNRLIQYIEMSNNVQKDMTAPASK